MRFLYSCISMWKEGNLYLLVLLHAFLLWSLCLHVMSFVVVLMVFNYLLENGSWHIRILVQWYVLEWKNLLNACLFSGRRFFSLSRVPFWCYICNLTFWHLIVSVKLVPRSFYTFRLRSFMMMQYVRLLGKSKRTLNGFLELVIKFFWAKL